MGTYVPTEEQQSFLKRLFRSLKAEDDHNLEDNLIDIFVETDEYEEAQVSGNAIVVGRKGSGKTALLVGFAKNNESTFHSHCKINADEMPITALYNYFLSDMKKKASRLEEAASNMEEDSLITELATFIEPTRLSTFAWQKAFQILALYLAAGLILDSEDLSKSDARSLRKLRDAIKGQLKDDNPTAFLFSLLAENYDEASEVIEEAISEFVGPTVGKLVSLVINKIITRFGSTLPGGFEEVSKYICDRAKAKGLQILITFDRFDDFYDKHADSLRMLGSNNEKEEERDGLLSSIVEGLILGVTEIKKSREFSWVSLLVTIPMDRFLSLRLRERARIESEYVIMLHWSPKELFEMVNRRIRMALKDAVPSDQEAWYHLFPETITNSQVPSTREDSFLYLLRHSLWKPREVMMYTEALMIRFFSGGYSIENRDSLFRDIIHEKSREIIRQEFLEEFRIQFPGLRKLLTKLRSSKVTTVMSLPEAITAVGFDPLSGRVNDGKELLELFFRMGIVGSRTVSNIRKNNFGATVRQENSQVCYSYFYNCIDNDPFPASCSVCFHPMFFEELDLRHEVDFVVNELKWEMFQ